MGKLTLDDGLLDDPVVAKAGVIGFALHIAGLMWCSRNGRDAIPWERVSCLLDLSGLSIDVANPAGVAGGSRSMAGEDGVDAHVIAKHLVKIGLWEEITVERVLHEGTPREETIDSIEAFRLPAPRALPPLNNVIEGQFRQ